jgi:hypothetical protein
VDEIKAENAFEDHNDVTAAEKKSADANEAAVTNRQSFIPRKSFCRELAFWSGYHYPTPFWKTLLHPLKMFRSPIVLWTSLVYMTAITWIVILTVGASQIFASAPYNFSISAVGNVFVSPFIASVTGTLVAKPLIDGGVKFLARKNRGVFGRSCLSLQPFVERGHSRRKD